MKRNGITVRTAGEILDQIEEAVQNEIRAMRNRLAALEGYPATRVGRPESKRRQRAENPKRRMSPKTRALRKRQGRYMGFVRRLNQKQKANVRAVFKKSGISVATKLAAQLSKAKR
jgi:hypothetical protein